VLSRERAPAPAPAPAPALAPAPAPAPAPVMKDKIVEARPRSNKRKECKKSKSDLTSEESKSNCFKVDSELTNHLNGITEKLLHKTELSTSCLANEYTFPYNGDSENKSKKDLDDIKAIIKLDRLNSEESNIKQRIKSQNSFDFHLTN